MVDNPGSPSTGRGLHFGALPAGYPLGQYRFQSVLGVGGFGITYRAMDDRLRRPVAIKEFLPSDFATRVNGIEVRPRAPTDQEMFTWGLKRFLDEARVLAALNDAPNIVHVYDYLEANGTGYMVMELIEGEPLDKVLARIGKIPPPSLPPLLQSLLRGLEAVHRAGYLHRDIKPGNVLVRPNGEPVLVDFGAARMSMGKRTQIMTSIYSPGYAPPEQYAFGTAEANKQGPWGDLYALAATLYHAITGAAPADSVRRLAKDNYIPLTQAAAGQYPPGFLAAIDAALALPVDRRPQSVPAWGQMLFGDSRAYPGGPPQQPAVAGPGPMSQGGPYAPAGPASAQGAYAPAGAAWGAGGTYGNAPPGQGFDAAIASRSGAHAPAAGQAPPLFAPAAPPPPPYSRSPAAPPPTKRSGGAGLWIALGALVVLLTAGGAGAYYYLCVLKTYCGGTDEDPAACYEDLARVRAEIQRVLARLPGQPAPSATPNLSCKEELAKAKADLQRLQELERSKPTTPTPIPPVVTPKPPVIEPQPPIPPLEPKPPIVEPKPPTPPVDLTPKPPVIEPQPPPVDPKPPIVEPRPPTPPPVDVTPVPKPPVAEPKPPPVVAKPPTPQPPPPPTEPPSPYAVHEGRWFGSANLTREQGAGRCAPAFTLSGMVRDNIFTGSSSVHGSASIRIRSRTKRVTDMSLPGLTVKSTNGTFDAFTMETSTGCTYAVRMFRQ